MTAVIQPMRKQKVVLISCHGIVFHDGQHDFITRKKMYDNSHETVQTLLLLVENKLKTMYSHHLIHAINNPIHDAECSVIMKKLRIRDETAENS